VHEYPPRSPLNPLLFSHARKATYSIYQEVFMHQHGSSNQPQSNKPNRGQTRFSLPIKLVLYATIGIIAFFLITEHLAHLAGFFPLLLILFLCMFMHLFMHGGHGGNDGSGDRKHQH
jgi:hypothetical protein